MNEAERAGRRVAGSKPRGRWANTEEREALELAKTKLRKALTSPECVAVVTGWLTGGKGTTEDFQWAWKEVADRVGMPRLTQQEIAASNVQFPVYVFDLGGGVAVLPEDSGTGE